MFFRERLWMKFWRSGWYLEQCKRTCATVSSWSVQYVQNGSEDRLRRKRCDRKRVCPVRSLKWLISSARSVLRVHGWDSRWCLNVPRVVFDMELRSWSFQDCSICLERWRWMSFHGKGGFIISLANSAAQAALSALSLPGMPECDGIHWKLMEWEADAVRNASCMANTNSG